MPYIFADLVDLKQIHVVKSMTFGS